MNVAILMMAQSVGTPDQLAALRLQHPLHFAELALYVLWVQVLDHRRADDAVEGSVGKSKLRGIHLSEGYLLTCLGIELPQRFPYSFGWQVSSPGRKSRSS